MRKTLLPLLFLILTSPLFAQQSWSIPLNLYAKVANLPPAEMIGILVEGNPVEIAKAAKTHGGFLSYNTGTICSVHIPAGELVGFSHEPGIVRIGNAPVKLQPLNDTMKAQTGIYDVHNGLSPLSQSYKGDGVIVGMIDSGIDFTHPDFQDSLGKTRILYIWDQRDPNGTGPAPWNYGTLWDSAQINAGQCTHNDLAYYGHGTHVTGIAAGNGRSTTARDYSGAAPNADIIMVALDFNGANSPVAVADAAAYIYAQATALGRECVINASVGDYYGSHDGQDLQALMIDSLLDMSSSRAFVTASGNAGNEPIHLSYSLSSDTNFTWFASSGPAMYIQLWADTNNWNNAQMGFGCTQDGSWIEKGSTPFTNIAQNLNIYSWDTIYNSSGQRMAVVARYGSIQGSAYSMEYVVTPDSAAGYDYSLRLTGSGLFHLWCFDLNWNPLPAAAAYPKIVYYKEPDTTYTLCSSFQCSNKTITVGNYVNRRTWMNVNNTLFVDTTVTAGEIMYNSSVGPTRDGRQKPDIAAPGANDISCGVISTLPGIIAGAPDYVGIGGYHIVGGGTSAASPVVAGSVALWMQAYPGSNWQEAKNAVIYCAKQDTFTGSNLPDITWGFGKIDAFHMITNCAPLSTNDGTILPAASLNVFPNPLSEGQSLTVTFPATTEAATLQLYNMQGQLVHEENVSSGTTTAAFSTAGHAGGCYMLVMHSGTNVITTRVMIN